jgi:hypothetical protein
MSTRLTRFIEKYEILYNKQFGFHSKHPTLQAALSITVARHIFQACPVWIYTQSNITQASYSPEYITP